MQIPDLIANELMKIGRYEVVDRPNLNQVVKQQGLQQSGLFDSGGQAEELGTLAKADYAVFGRISEFATKRNAGLLAIPKFGGNVGSEEAKVNILIKIVDLKTGVVLATHEAHGEANAAILGGAGYTDILFGAAQFDDTAAGRATRKAAAAATKAVIDALPATCPKCGSKITGNDKFCPDCGADLKCAPAVCRKCHQPLKAGDNFCRNCGQKVGE
jgi:curli biogenesis system outer membrane secretion channel CsgG